MEYESSFIPKSVLRPKYGNLSKNQGFLMQGLHRMYLFVTLEFVKEMIPPLHTPYLM